MKVFKKKGRSLVKEYIFVDIQRLESYVAQIKGDVKYDRVPTWNVGLSATSPALGTSIQKVARKPNYHEMITLLLDHLQKSQQLDVERESTMFRSDEVLFCHETCMARKVLFPANLFEDIPGIKELALWISLEPDSKPEKEEPYPAGPLYLIESYSEDDSPYLHAMSGYSALHYMLHEMGETFRELIAWETVGREEAESLARKFAVAPFEYFARLKAQVSDPRRIECLYRRRATMVDLDIHELVTFGYPIYIAEMPEPLPT